MSTFLKRLTWANFAALFANRENLEIAEQVRELMAAATSCAAKLGREVELRETDMIEDEHRGDAALEKIEKAIERGFIVRFGKGSPSQLAHELDDVIDGMRDVARHIETYRIYLDPFPQSSSELMRTITESIKYLSEMVNEIFSGRINSGRLSDLAASIIDLERKADTIRAGAERALAAAAVVTDPRAFIAPKDLNDQLESITDHTRHCAIIALSIARQEA